MKSIAKTETHSVIYPRIDIDIRLAIAIHPNPMNHHHHLLAAWIKGHMLLHRLIHCIHDDVSLVRAKSLPFPHQQPRTIRIDDGKTRAFVLYVPELDIFWIGSIDEKDVDHDDDALVCPVEERPAYSEFLEMDYRG